MHSNTADSECSSADEKFLSKELSALQRCIKAYQDIMVLAQGNRLKSAAMLWKRSRHDSALKEDLTKAACAFLSIASVLDGEHIETVSVPTPPGRGGRVSKLESDHEVATFIKERLGNTPLQKIATEAQSQFGKKRAPGKSAIHRYWHRLIKIEKQTD